MRILPADFSDPELVRFLEDHLRDMEPTAPPESRHALDLTGLQRPGIRMWVARIDSALVGTVALAPVEDGHEELKSMRTDPTRRGQGIGTTLLEYAIADAQSRGVRRVSLETGSMAFFEPARTMYRRYGFVDCEPFGSYATDPNSVFLTISLPR